MLIANTTLIICPYSLRELPRLNFTVIMKFTSKLHSLAIKSYVIHAYRTLCDVADGARRRRIRSRRRGLCVWMRAGPTSRSDHRPRQSFLFPVDEACCLAHLCRPGPCCWAHIPAAYWRPWTRWNCWSFKVGRWWTFENCSILPIWQMLFENNI